MQQIEQERLARSSGVQVGGQAWKPKRVGPTGLQEALNMYAGNKEMLPEVLKMESQRSLPGMSQYIDSYYQSIGRSDLLPPTQPKSEVTQIGRGANAQGAAFAPGTTPQQVLSQLQPQQQAQQLPVSPGLYTALTPEGTIGAPRTEMQKAQAFAKSALMDQAGAGVPAAPETADTWLNTKGQDQWAATASRLDPKGKVKLEYTGVRPQMAYYQKQTEQFSRNAADALAAHGTQPFKTVDEYVDFIQSVPGYSPLIKEHAKKIASRFMPANLKQQQQDQEMTTQLQGMGPGERKVVAGRVVEGPEYQGMDLQAAQGELAKIEAAGIKGYELVPQVTPQGTVTYGIDRTKVDKGEVKAEKQTAEDVALAQSMYEAGNPPPVDTTGKPLFGTEAKQFIDPLTGEYRAGTKRYAPPGVEALRPPANMMGLLTPEEQTEWQTADPKRQRAIRQQATERFMQTPVKIRRKKDGAVRMMPRTQASTMTSDYEIVP